MCCQIEPFFFWRNQPTILPLVLIDLETSRAQKPGEICDRETDCSSLDVPAIRRGTNLCAIVFPLTRGKVPGWTHSVPCMLVSFAVTFSVDQTLLHYPLSLAPIKLHHVLYNNLNKVVEGFKGDACPVT